MGVPQQYVPLPLELALNDPPHDTSPLLLRQRVLASVEGDIRCAPGHQRRCQTSTAVDDGHGDALFTAPCQGIQGERPRFGSYDDALHAVDTTV
jgi:hypothetical protein